MPKTTLGVNIDTSVEEIRNMSDGDLAVEDCSYGYLIRESGVISVDAIDRNVSGDPDVYYRVTRILHIPTHRKAEVLADFLKRNRRKFYTVCSQMYSEYDNHGNKVGRITRRGLKAFDELVDLISEFASYNDELVLVDPEIYFYDVQSIIADAETVDEAISVAFEMAEEGLKENPNLAANWRAVEKYATELWREYNVS